MEWMQKLANVGGNNQSNQISNPLADCTQGRLSPQQPTYPNFPCSPSVVTPSPLYSPFLHSCREAPWNQLAVWGAL